jgi:hypothetical protein
MPDFDWDIKEMVSNPETGRVLSVHFVIRASDESSNQTAQAYGSVGLAGDVLIPYEQITKAEAVEWVKAGLCEEGVTNLRDRLVDKLAEKASPPVRVGCPWDASPMAD